MREEFVLINVRPNGEAAKDVVVRDGRFAEIVPHGSRAFGGMRVVDGEGLLLLPGLVDAHTHLDKTLLGMPWYRNDVGLELIDLIENERRMKRELGIDPQRQSAAQIERSVANGTTHIRTHVDIDTEYGLAGLEGVLASRERYRDIVDIEIVAFPQSGMLPRAGTLDLMDAAMRAGADIVGGIDPATIDRDPVRHLGEIFALAERYGKPIDIHLHEPGDLGAFCLELIVERTRALAMQGRVMVSHAYCLGMLDPARQRALIEAMAAENISVMTVGSPTAPALPLRLMRECGLTTASGSDGIQGTWEPWGNGDMLERAKYLAQRNGMTNDADLAETTCICTFGGAEGIGLSGYGFANGDFGDVVLVPARTLAEAVALTPQKRTVIRRGRVLVRNGEPVAELSSLFAL